MAVVEPYEHRAKRYKSIEGDVGFDELLQIYLSETDEWLQKILATKLSQRGLTQCEDVLRQKIQTDVARRYL
jgi:hypothetical protein